MIRKSMIALAAVATLGAAALAPTAASAFPKHHHHHHWGPFGGWWGVGFIDTVPAADCYLVKTGYKRYVRVCD